MEIELDIHNMTKIEARILLERMIDSAKKDTQIRVIHGYRKGNELLKMVRGMKHKRIKQKILTLNFGETILVID